MGINTDMSKVLFCKNTLDNSMDSIERNYFRIFLSNTTLNNSSHHSSIYFIKPYADLPLELEKLKGLGVFLKFDFLQTNTEHKDILFKYPYIMGAEPYVQIHLRKHETDNFLNIFSSVYTEFKKSSLNFEKVIISYINVLFLISDRLIPKNKVVVGKHHYTNLLIMSKFRALLFSHGMTTRHVDFYADQLNLTPNYLNVVLKLVSGKNASTHIHEFVINEAKYRLIHSVASLKEVAHELGFSSQSYFTRFFKKHAGVKPLEWFNHQVFS